MLRDSSANDVITDASFSLTSAGFFFLTSGSLFLSTLTWLRVDDESLSLSLSCVSQHSSLWLLKTVPSGSFSALWLQGTW